MALKSNLNDREQDKFEEVATETTHRTSSYTLDYPLKKRRDDISSLLYYVGESKDPDALDSDASWRIYRYSKSGSSTTESYALDGTFTGVWDNRYDYFGAVTDGYTNTFSVKFANKGDYVNIGNIPSLSFERTDAFSLSTWMKVSNINERVIFSKQGASSATGYRWFTQSNEMRFLLSGGSSGNRIEVHTAALSISDGNWHQATVTYSGSSLASGVKFYLDGTLLSTGTYTISSDTLSLSILNTTAAQISGRNGTTNTFEGSLNNFAVWNKVLSAAEVLEIYDTAKPQDLRDHSAVSSLILFMKVYDANDVASFPVFTDLSASGTNGTGVSITKDQINIDVP